MEPTWQEDLNSLHAQRKNYLKSLRYLQQQRSKMSRVSVGLEHELEEIEKRLHEVEARILILQTEHLAELEQASDAPKILKPSLYSRKDLILEEGELLSDESAISDKQSTPVVPHRVASYPLSLVASWLGALALVVAIATGGWFLGKSVEGRSRTASPTTTAQGNADVTNQVDIPQQRLGEIVIYADYYHLGDVFIEQFHASQPQPNPFIALFQVSQSGESAHLSLTAAHVDPNVEQSPVDIYLNGSLVANLNHYFEEESLLAKTVMIPIDSALLRTGVNEIKIEVRSTITEYGKNNLDDFEFWGLTLHID